MSISTNERNTVLTEELITVISNIVKNIMTDQPFVYKVQQLDTISYDKVIDFFIKKRPLNEKSIVKGGVLRRINENEEHEIILLFLNSSNEPVINKVNNRMYAAKLIVKNLDEELTEMLSDNNLFLVE